MNFAYSKWWSVWAFFTLIILHSARETSPVRILEVKVPPQVKVEETVELSCIFDMEDKVLYSLNWWKGGQQFYLFTPLGIAQNQTIYDTQGIHVDMSRSGLNVLVLRNVSTKTSGLFKCEVVADYPSYERDSRSSFMEVVEVPHRPPVLSIGRIQFNVGEVLEANCSSPGIKPPSKLVWLINGQKVNTHNTRILPQSSHPSSWYGESLDDNPGVIHVGDMEDLHIMRMDEVPLPPITSNVKIVLRDSHFSSEGRAILTCIASLPGLYQKSTDVHLTLPGVAPVTSSHRISNGGESQQPKVSLSISAISFICASRIFLVWVPFKSFDLFYYFTEEL